MTSEQQAIISLLRQVAVGKGNAITADEIYSQLVSQGHQLFQGRTQEQVRQIVRDLVNSQVELIGSTSTGYYIVSNVDEARDSVQSLKGRADKIQDRADNLENLWNSQNPNNPV